MRKLRKIIIASIFFVFFAACASLALSEIFDIKKPESITIVNEIDVTSEIKTPGYRKYNSTVKGTIINNTDEELKNVKIIVTAETSITEREEDLVITIDSLPAHKTFYINHTIETTLDLEEVEDVKYSINDGKPITLDNPEEEDSNFEFIIYIVMGVMCLSAGITTLTAKVKKGETLFNPVHDEFDDDDDDDDDDDFHEEEIERLKGEVEKQKAENEELKKQANSLKVCPYCNTKSPANSLKCPNCGAHLK